MKSSSNPSASETRCAASWQPPELGPQQKTSRPELGEKLMSILSPGEKAAEGSPAPQASKIARSASQPAYKAWQPGEMQPERGIFPETAPETPVFLSVPDRRPTVEMRGSPRMDAHSLTAFRMIADARSKADEILRQAQQAAGEAAQSMARQMQQAIAEGYAQGKQEAQAEAASSIQSAQAMIAELADWREQMIAQSEETVVSMIRQIARLMFGSGFCLEKDALQTYLSEVVENTRSLGELNILLNPDDLSKLEPAWTERQSQLHGSPVHLIASPGVMPGGCLIKGQMGSVDASIDTKLAAIFETLSSEQNTEVMG